MRLVAPAIALVLGAITLTACSSSDSEEGTAGTGGTGAGGSSQAAKKPPGTPCEDPEECACILCSCDTGWAIAEACDEQAWVCADGPSLCDTACEYVFLGGQKGKWTGEWSVVDCPLYGGLSLWRDGDVRWATAWPSGR